MPQHYVGPGLRLLLTVTGMLWPLVRLKTTAAASCAAVVLKPELLVGGKSKASAGATVTDDAHRTCSPGLRWSPPGARRGKSVSTPLWFEVEVPSLTPDLLPLDAEGLPLRRRRARETLADDGWARRAPASDLTSAMKRAQESAGLAHDAPSGTASPATHRRHGRASTLASEAGGGACTAPVVVRASGMEPLATRESELCRAAALNEPCLEPCLARLTPTSLCPARAAARAFAASPLSRVALMSARATVMSALS